MRKILAVAAAALFVTPAAAQQYTITDLDSPLPAGENWGVIPGENTGTVSIQGETSNDGDGALMLTGDRTRVQTGVQYGGGTPTGATLDQVSTLTFEWMVANGGPNGNASPALRLLVQDGDQRSELIWEAAYNDANGAGAGFYDLDTWYNSNPNAVFWRFVAGQGPTFDPASPGTYVFNTIAGWGASSFYTDSAFVSGLSVGNGSGSGANFVGYADNVAASGTFGSRSFNFAAVAAVPEPGTWAMMLLGFGVIGGAMRRQRRASHLLQMA